MNETRMEKFNAKCPECGSRAVADVEIYDEEYVSLLRKNSNSLQQLKAKIAKVIPRITQAYVDRNDSEINKCVSVLATISRSA